MKNHSWQSRQPRRTAGTAMAFAFLAAAVVPAGSANAATVKSARTSKVLLQLDEGEKVSVGDQITVQSPDGTKSATLVITTTKGRRAIGEIQSGEVSIGDVTESTGTVEKKKKKP